MKTLLALSLACIVLCAAGCDQKSTEPGGQPAVTTLLAGLEYPTGMWVSGGLVYFTETNGRNTVFGGVNTLSVYDTGSRVRRVLVQNPVNADAVAVTDEGAVYLTSWHGAIPGNFGKVSVVDTATRVETHVVDIPIASVDMFVDGLDDLYIIGSSDSLQAASAVVLRHGTYTTVETLHPGLGRAQCLSLRGAAFYYADQGAIRRFVSNIWEEFAPIPARSISFSPAYLFYADRAAGTVGKIEVSTKNRAVVLRGLRAPSAVRWDESRRTLYVLEAGTVDGQFKDGRLISVTGIR